MTINRRTLLQGLAPAIAFPYLLRSDPAQAAAPRLRKVGKPIRLGKNQPGGKSRVTLSPFDENSLIAGWINTRSFTDSRAFVQKRHYDGTALSQEIQMGGGPLTDGIIATNIAVVAFPDGSSHVYFAAQRNGANDFDAMDIFLQRMSPSFKKVGGPIAVNTSSAGAQDAVLARRLDNGNVQVVWFSDQTIRGRIIKPNGQPGSREKTLVRTKPGTHVPKSLGQGPNGGSLLSYIRIADAGTSKGGVEFQKVIQPLQPNATPDGQLILADITAFGLTGAPGIWDGGDFNLDAEVAYFGTAPNSDSVASLHQIDFNFNSPSPPNDDVVGKFAIPSGWQGAPRVVRYQADNRPYLIVFFPIETAQGHAIKGLMVRPLNASVVDDLLLGPFDPAFITVDAVVGLDGRFMLGYVLGDDLLSDSVFLQPIAAGTGAYPY